MFLSKHAHEQMYIKKDLEEEKDDPTGILVESKEQVTERRKKIYKRDAEAKASVIPTNVLQQIYIWEEEMNTVNSQNGILISNFESREKYKQFLQYLRSVHIPDLARSDKSAMVVVPIENQKEIYEFLNRH